MRSLKASGLLPGVLLLSSLAVAEAAPRPRFVEGEVIVKFKRPLTAAGMASVARRGNSRATISRQAINPVTGTGDPRMALSRFPRTESVEATVARLRSLPDVEYAEPNFIVTLGEPHSGRTLAAPQTITRRVGRAADGRALTRTVPAADVRSLVATYPNDPGQLLQWGWTWISADIVWPDTKSSEVAVVDTGVDGAHPELYGLVTSGYDYINDDRVANDDNGHGTHVAGTIAARANNKTGFAGVARSRIYAVKVLDAAGSGTYFDIAQGIRLAANRTTVKVINVSLGGPDPSQTLEDAVNYAVVTKGKLLVAAAGNESVAGQPPASTPFYPAAYSEIFPERVMAVAASGVYATGSGDGQSYFAEGCRADYSNWGDYVNITAPGTDIYSTQPWKKEFYNNRYFGSDPDLDGYDVYSGTSMAAPHVSAVAARVQASNLAFTNVDVFRRLLDRGFDTQVGTGIDVDGDSVDDIVECWETSAIPFTPVALPAFKDVDAALALGRARVTGRLLDATTGLGLTGATPSLIKGTSTVVSYGGTIATVGTSFFELINVPWNDQTGVGPVTPPYRLRVIRSGSTPSTGSIVEDYSASDVQKPGISIPFGDLNTSLRQISLPPYDGRYTLVADWGDWNGGGYLASTELDLHVFRPRANDLDDGCSIGYFDLVGLGGCGDPDSIGTLVTYPYARWMRDGGPTDGLGTETTVFRKLLSTAPLPTQPDNRYRIFMQDPFLDGTGFLEQDAYPVVRLWRSGVVRATIRFDTTFVFPTCIPAGGASVCDLWNIGSLSSAGTFTPINTLGDDTAFPYLPPGGGGGSGSRSGRPTRARTGSATVAGGASVSGTEASGQR